MSEPVKTPETENKPVKKDTVMEMLMSEGGFTLLIILPLVVFFFLSMAVR